MNAWKIERRRRTFELKALGWKQRDIAEAFGVSEAAVSRWLSGSSDPDAWGGKGRAGRRPRLSDDQLQQLPTFLARGAPAYGFRGEVWTAARAAKVTRDHLSVMSALTTTGRLLTRVRSHSFSSADSVAFLRHLQHQIDGKIWVIWDGTPIHSGEVRTFLAAGGAERIHLERLPAYAPDLNPDGGVWQQLKHVEMGNLCCSDLGDLRRQLRLATMRLQNKPHLLRACFAGAGLPLGP